MKESENDHGYYELRLNEIKRIYIQEGREILDKNLDKIKKLVEEYREKFQETTEFNSTLVESIETFIL